MTMTATDILRRKLEDERAERCRLEEVNRELLTLVLRLAQAQAQAIEPGHDMPPRPRLAKVGA